MNILKAVVSDIRGEDALHVIEFEYHDNTLCMMGLELPSIKIGSKVLLSVKPTHLSLAKGKIESISMSNRIRAKVIEVENGKILSRVVLDSGFDELESIITLSSSLRMGLKKEDEVLMLIKASELFIKEVL